MSTPSVSEPVVVVNDRIIQTGWLQSYLHYTSAQESPPTFHMWVAIATIAAVLRRNVYLGRGYYKLYPNLYTILTAPSGRCRKTTAEDIGVAMLREVDGLHILHEKVTPEGLIDQLSKHAMQAVVQSVTEINKDKSKTQKQVGKIDITQQCHTLIYAPELSVFLGGQSYTSGLIELLTSLYGGRDKWDYTTKTGGKTMLYNVIINLLGASNPEWLAKGFQEDSFSGGFMGRCIFIYQEKGSRNAWPQPTPEQEALRLLLISDLQKISHLKGGFAVAQDAYEFYDSWYNKYEGDLSGRLAGYYERKPEHILKLAMILSISRDNSLVITLNDIYTAMNMLNDVEQFMPKAFAYIGATNEAKVSQHVLEAIAAEGGVMKHGDLLRKIRHMIKGRHDFDEMMGTLEESGLVRELYAPKERSKLWFIPESYDKMADMIELEKKEAADAAAARCEGGFAGAKVKQEKEDLQQIIADAIGNDTIQ